MENKSLPVYILIRTADRPLFFKKMMDSIKSQTYKNIITIVHSDNKEDDYVEGDIVIYSERNESLGRGHYNLYNNKLLKSIPDGPGWYHFIDDDDMYYDDNVIENLVKKSKVNCINVARVQRWDDTIYPARWGDQKSYQTECFFLHTKHKDKAEWPTKTGGDHFYSKQLTAILKINWIENLINCKAQTGKGRGLRFDLDQEDELAEWVKNRPQKEKNGKVLIKVKYLKRVKGRRSQRGRINDIKYITFENSKKLLKENKIEIIGEKLDI